MFRDIYGFRFGVLGVAFLSIAVGCLLAIIVWIGYFYFFADKVLAEIMATGVMPPPETRLAPGLIFTFFIPAGLFLFGKSPLLGVIDEQY